MVKRDKEELSEEERKALRGSKFAPLPPPSLSKPRLGLGLGLGPPFYYYLISNLIQFYFLFFTEL